MARRRRGRPVDGLIVLNKPVGMSSNDAVQAVKRLFGAGKVGHTGSLDPLATGVLPLCFGEATKFSQYLLDSDKRYWTRIKLGVRTQTGDRDGEIVERREVVDMSAARIEQALCAFRGAISQVPSMYSALKHNGQPLYKLARQGIEVERKARQIEILRNELVAFEGDELELEVHCTKGTYIRTLAEDLGEALGVGAHVVELHRRGAGPFDEQDMIELAMLEEMREQRRSLDEFLMPIASAVGQWPEVRLRDDSAFYVKQGQPVIVPHAPTNGWVRLTEITETAVEKFIGVGEVLDDGRIAPRRLVAG
ncbi:MAG: tRNA pseudouridine(55) synthase TruB [Pseudomonadota bacterium]